VEKYEVTFSKEREERLLMEKKQEMSVFD